MDRHNNPSPSFANVFVLLLFAVIIAVISVVSTYYVLTSRQTEQYAGTQTTVSPPQTYMQPTTTVPVETIQTTLDEMANWKVYRNKEFGYEIKYPINWLVSNDLGDLGLNKTVDFGLKLSEAPDKHVIREIGILSYFDWEEGVKNGILLNFNENLSLKENVEKYIGNNTEETIFGKDRIKGLKQEVPGEVIEYSIWFVGNDLGGNKRRLYRIDFPKESKYQEILIQMLSTFKFLE